MLRHLLEMLRLKEDDISSFRAQIFAKDNKARVEHAITKARNVQRSLPTRPGYDAIWRCKRAEEADRSKSVSLMSNDCVSIRKTTSRG